jgi:hypothetical protein
MLSSIAYRAAGIVCNTNTAVGFRLLQQSFATQTLSGDHRRQVNMHNCMTQVWYYYHKRASAGAHIGGGADDGEHLEVNAAGLASGSSASTASQQRLQPQRANGGDSGRVTNGSAQSRNQHLNGTTINGQPIGESASGSGRLRLQLVRRLRSHFSFSAASGSSGGSRSAAQADRHLAGGQRPLARLRHAFSRSRSARRYSTAALASDAATFADSSRASCACAPIGAPAARAVLPASTQAQTLQRRRSGSAASCATAVLALSPAAAPDAPRAAGSQLQPSGAVSAPLVLGADGLPARGALRPIRTAVPASMTSPEAPVSRCKVVAPSEGAVCEDSSESWYHSAGQSAQASSWAQPASSWTGDRARTVASTSEVASSGVWPAQLPSSGPEIRPSSQAVLTPPLGAACRVGNAAYGKVGGPAALAPPPPVCYGGGGSSGGVQVYTNGTYNQTPSSGRGPPGAAAPHATEPNRSGGAGRSPLEQARSGAGSTGVSSKRSLLRWRQGVGAAGAARRGSRDCGTSVQSSSVHSGESSVMMGRIARMRARLQSSGASVAAAEGSGEASR